MTHSQITKQIPEQATVVTSLHVETTPVLLKYPPIVQNNQTTIHLDAVINIATTIAPPTIYMDAILVIQNHTPTPTGETQV